MTDVAIGLRWSQADAWGTDTPLCFAALHRPAWSALSLRCFGAQIPEIGWENGTRSNDRSDSLSLPGAKIQTG